MYGGDSGWHPIRRRRSAHHSTPARAVPKFSPMVNGLPSPTIRGNFNVYVMPAQAANPGS